MELDVSKSRFKRFVPKHEARSALWWIIQRLSGFFLFFLILFHMLINHYISELIPTNIAETYGIASFEAVQWKMQQPLYLIISMLFVLFLAFHMLNGLRTVIFDLAPGKKIRTVFVVLLLLIGIGIVLYALILNLTVANLPTG
ncbi:MAG: succinate dehydrogenase, hydrophobic membrane anchor protein [Candidatus Hodarchaeota archaeon]